MSWMLIRFWNCTRGLGLSFSAACLQTSGINALFAADTSTWLHPQL